MGQIKIDQFGRFYETSSDREDGKGYKSHAAPVTQGDVTFGAAHSKAMTEHMNSIKRDMHSRAIEDRQAEITARQQMGARAAGRAHAHREMALRDNDSYQSGLLLTALDQGYDCCCEGSSVNDQTQQAIKGALGMGKAMAFPVDPIEAHQAQLNQLNVSNLKQQARLNEARQHMGRTAPRIGVPVKPSAVAVHPMNMGPVIPKLVPIK